MEKEKQTVIIVTAYGEDNYYQKRYEYVVGIYTTVNKAIGGAKYDGLTNSQIDFLNRINAFYSLNVAMLNNKGGVVFQVDYEEETDEEEEPCKSSYMFRTFNLD